MTKAPKPSQPPPPPEDTARYRIGAVAKLTGLSAHQLRVWERRYGAFSPSRSEGGGRLYSQADIDRLRLIKRLAGYGNAIAQIAHLPLAELQRLAARIQVPSPPEPVLIPAAPGVVVKQSFLEAIAALRTSDAERVLAQSSLAFDPRRFVLDVLLPLAQAVGERWQNGDFGVSHEHAATEVLRSQLALLLRTFAQPADAPTVVSATPAGERHALGALGAALIAVANSRRVIYLGPDVPAADLVESAVSSRAASVLLSVPCGAPELPEYLRAVRAGLPAKVEVIVGGAAAAGQVPSGVTYLPSLEALDDWLRV